MMSSGFTWHGEHAVALAETDIELMPMIRPNHVGTTDWETTVTPFTPPSRRLQPGTPARHDVFAVVTALLTVLTAFLLPGVGRTAAQRSRPSRHPAGVGLLPARPRRRLPATAAGRASRVRRRQRGRRSRAGTPWRPPAMTRIWPLSSERRSRMRARPVRRRWDGRRPLLEFTGSPRDAPSPVGVSPTGVPSGGGSSSTLDPMPTDTLVFIPAWNEEDNLPGRPRRTAGGASRRRRPRRRRRLHRRDRRPSRVRTAPRSSRSARTGDCGRGSPPATRTPSRGATRSRGRVDADGQHPVDELVRLLEIVRAGDADVAVGSRFATGERIRGVPLRAVAEPPARHVPPPPCDEGALGRPFHDATSGMYAANRRALPGARRPLHERRTRGRVAPASSRSGTSGRGGARAHARARERRVEAPRREGRPARDHGRRHAAPVRRLAPTAASAVTRLVAVLGYSDAGGRTESPPVSARHGSHAEEQARPDDVVLFTGWARGGRATSEAELMATSWTTPSASTAGRPRSAHDTRQRDRGRPRRRGSWTPPRSSS